MNKKYIVAIIALMFILIIAGVFFGGQSSTNRADNELVVAVAGHGGEPEEGFDPMLGWVIVVNLSKKTWYKKYITSSGYFAIFKLF